MSKHIANTFSHNMTPAVIRALLFVALALLQAAHAAEAPLDPLLEAERDYDQDRLGGKVAAQLMAQARTDAPLGRLAALMVRHQHRLADDAAALGLAARVLLSTEDAAQWHEQVAAGVRGKTYPNPAAAGLALLPEPARWNLADDRIETGLALAELLATTSRAESASLAIAAALEQGRGLAHVLALESASGLKAVQHDLEGAIAAEQAAIAGIATLAAGSDGANRPLDPREQLVRDRLEARLAELIRRFDEERYGPGFVRYREAERLRRIDHDAAAATVAYNAIIREFPGTIWAEASGCYRVKCLLALARPRDVARTRQRLAALTAQIEAQAQLRKSAGRLALPAASIKRIAARLDELDAEYQALEAVPLGPPARQRAEQRATEFRRAQPLGLYREECAVDLAVAGLAELEPERAKALGQEAWDLCIAVAAADAGVAAVEVPAAVRAVSAPPDQPEQQNAMGTERPSQAALGALLNRQTAPWWLASLRESLAVDMAILALASGDGPAARKWLERVPGGASGADDEWDNRGRLGWALEHGHIFALPAELAQYSGRARLAVLIADGCYVTADYDGALMLTDRLIAGEFGQLSRAAGDYPRYLRAWCRYRGAYAGGSEELGPAQRFVLDLETVLATREQTLTESRAAWMIGQAAKDCSDPVLQALGVRRHEELIASGADDNFARKARLALGLSCLRAGQRQRGLALLHGFPPSAKDWNDAAERLIALVPADPVQPSLPKEPK